MKHLLAVCVLFASSLAFGNTIVVSPMKVIPKKVKSFANNLYSDVSAQKKLIEIFLREGRSAQTLSEEEKKLNDATSIQNQITKHADGSESCLMLLHGCTGVFTDKKGVVYFWRLSSPQILSVTSQNREFTFLILKKAYPELLRGRGGRKP